MIYFESVKAVSVSQSHVITQFYIGHSSCGHEASTDRCQPPHRCFLPQSPVKPWLTFHRTWLRTKRDVNHETKRSRVFPCIFELESVRALVCCEGTNPVQSVQLGVGVISSGPVRTVV